MTARRLISRSLLTILMMTSLVAADDRRFRDSVAPILERHCLNCHAGKNAKGGLNLSTAATTFKGGDSGAAIIAGQPDKSPLITMISGEKPEMPKSAKPLSQKEIATIRRWIAEGAHWPKSIVLKNRSGRWWSFRALNSPAVPIVAKSHRDWIRTPIDAFILRKLAQHNLRPSPDADRRTLIRRLMFDLHGLPPTPADVAAFVNDSRPDAYERLVDRLLASPRYGERWARHWLDIVHYGDTHGFDKDKRRPHAWPYRDYVIRAFNADKPYGQFVREQLAGDVMRPRPSGGIAATGFIVAGPWDFVGQVELREGTVDKKITRNLDRDDMVMNAMSTFTSLTVHCARCHDHKFDPILQADYYSLQAVFAGVERANRNYDADPKIAIERAKLDRRRKQLQNEKVALEKAIAKLTKAKLGPIDARLFALQKPPSGKAPEYGYHSRIEKRQNVTKWVQVDLGKPTMIRQITLIGCDDDFAGIGAGFGFPVRYRVEVADDAKFRSNVRIVANRTKADVPNPGIARQTVHIDAQKARFVRITATKLAPRQNDFIFALAELQVRDADGNNLSLGKPVSSLDSIETPVRWRRSNLVDGKFVGLKNAKTAALVESLQKQREKLWNQLVPDSLKTRRDLNEVAVLRIERLLAKLPKPQLVYAASPEFKQQGNFTPSPDGRPRPIFVLNRGSVTAPGKPAQPGTVGLIDGLPARFALPTTHSEGVRRLALANWIVDRRNPLTWRSIVNRVWQYHFGNGLVDSPNDFGRMGAKPSHPELLDWLAAEFRDGRQSMKSLHRMIVTSAVYRARSESDPVRAKIDAGNRYLWRMNRRRLDAESLRDSLLTVSGSMRTVMYGPGYDLFGFKNDHSPRYEYEKHDPDDPRSLRRTLYRFIVRSVPDPLMETLDCADPSLNVPKRNITITALQALSLLNNVFVVRQAERFAERIAAIQPDPTKQLAVAYQLAFSRPPTADERNLLEPYLKQHGLKNLCRVLFNTNEFLFVD